MFASLAIAGILSTQAGGLPEEIRAVLEAQLPAWSQVMGNPTPASAADERIAVERSTSDAFNVVLIERKIKVAVMREAGRQWLADVVWCDQGADRCDDVWSRTDAQWRSDKATTNHTGYAVYRDSLRLSATSWTNPVGAMDFGKKKWDKGLCESGMCFVVSAKDSSVVRAAPRADGTISWWDGGYILGRSNEKELVHAYAYLLRKGHGIPFK